MIRAQNGQETVDKCRIDSSINLVLMNLKMPVLDGFEATTQIKEIAPNLPIIAQSALAKSEDIKNALDAGCNVHISKPIDEKKLISKKFAIFTDHRKKLGLKIKSPVYLKLKMAMHADNFIKINFMLASLIPNNKQEGI
ncbi:MAG: response regulator [Salinivirgaceae bacterium]|nr:response regulator [Salinivirgaceae bacterium]